MWASVHFGHCNTKCINLAFLTKIRGTIGTLWCQQTIKKKANTNAKEPSEAKQLLPDHPPYSLMKGSSAEVKQNEVNQVRTSATFYGRSVVLHISFFRANILYISIDCIQIAGSAESYFIWLKREEQRESTNNIKVSEWLFPSNQDV